eukprot:gene3751-4690_t
MDAAPAPGLASAGVVGLTAPTLGTKHEMVTVLGNDKVVHHVYSRYTHISSPFNGAPMPVILDLATTHPLRETQVLTMLHEYWTDPGTRTIPEIGRFETNADGASLAHAGKECLPLQMKMVTLTVMSKEKRKLMGLLEAAVLWEISAEQDLKASGQWGATRARTTQFKPRDFTSSTSGRTLDGHRSITSLLLSRSEAASACKGQCPELPDIDAADRENPLAVTAYVNDIYAYYRRVETQISPDYMAEQTDINDRMRAILVDWLVEVHLKFKLMPETLYLTTNLIDRYLAKDNVTRKNLQLVGVTAMLLAAKYEEIWAPEVRDFVYISDKAYTKVQILAMEKTMLRSLGFNLTVPTPYHFMFRYLKAAGADKKCELLTMFFAELAMPEYSMLKYSSSLLSAAAVYTALVTLGEPCFPPALKAHCGYTEEEIR